MDKVQLRDAAERLEREVAEAIAAGYENADCVLTSEVRALLALVNTGRDTVPVRIQKAGPAWNFLETRLGERVQLHRAWNQFCWIIEGRDSDPLVQADRALNPLGYET